MIIAYAEGPGNEPSTDLSWRGQLSGLGTENLLFAEAVKNL